MAKPLSQLFTGPAKTWECRPSDWMTQMRRPLPLTCGVWLELFKGKVRRLQPARKFLAFWSATQSEGKAFFAAKCSGCHSATGDLNHLASKFTDPKRVQNAWLSGGTPEEEDDQSGPRAVTAQINLPTGETIDGKLVRQDEFMITLQLADGSQRTFRRNGASPDGCRARPLKGSSRSTVEIQR